jgi:hypothetical protein
MRFSAHVLTRKQGEILSFWLTLVHRTGQRMTDWMTNGYLVNFFFLIKNENFSIIYFVKRKNENKKTNRFFLLNSNRTTSFWWTDWSLLLTNQIILFRHTLRKPLLISDRKKFSKMALYQKTYEFILIEIPYICSF